MKKLFRQIRREAARSPQKAAVLGLLALVALWFWSPLVLGWVRSDAKKKANAATAATLPLDLAAAGNPMVGAVATSSQANDPAVPGDWEEVIAWLDADPRIDAAAMAATRDPFVAIDVPPLEESLAEKADETPVAEEKPPELEPHDVGLKLTSTLVGPDGSLALISGKTYRPHDTIIASYASKTIEFTLAEVHPRRAVLLREGKSYSLNIPRPDGSEPNGQEP